MADQYTLRRAEADDADRIRALTESSLTTSYALSPQDIEDVAEAEFGEDAQRRRRDSEEYDSFVAESDEDGVVSGVVVVDHGDDTVRRLHVDPERRGMGMGSALYERAVEELTDGHGTGHQAVAMAANNAAGAFFEQFGLQQVQERTVEVGGRETVEYVYAEEADSEPSDAADDSAAGATGGETAADVDLDGLPDSVDDDGQTVYVGEDVLSGTEGAFVPTYLDDGLNEEYGYYCANCDSTDVSMDSMERIVCNDCGNTRKPDEGYDGAYL